MLGLWSNQQPILAAARDLLHEAVIPDVVEHAREIAFWQVRWWSVLRSASSLKSKNWHAIGRF
jgi:hypothetical protein